MNVTEAAKALDSWASKASGRSWNWFRRSRGHYDAIAYVDHRPWLQASGAHRQSALANLVRKVANAP